MLINSQKRESETKFNDMICQIDLQIDREAIERKRKSLGKKQREADLQNGKERARGRQRERKTP